MSNKTTEFYMAEIHRLTLEARRAESAERLRRDYKRMLDELLGEHHRLRSDFDTLALSATAEHVEILEEENKQLRAVIKEQQFYVAQRKACDSCEEHVDYAPNLQDMAKYFAGLLEVE